MSFRKFLYLVLAALSEVVATCLLKNMKGVLKFFPILGISIASLAGLLLSVPCHQNDAYGRSVCHMVGSRHYPCGFV
jgi:hypothetical protein